MHKKLTKKYLLLGIVLIICIISSAIILYLLQRPTNSRSSAAASTNINLLPGAGDPTAGTQTNPFQATVGQTIPVNLQIQPGTNAVSYVQIEIDYDPTVLAVDQTTGFTLTNASKMFFIEGPIYQPGKILAVFNIANAFVNALTQTTIVGNIPFQVIGNTDNTNGISSIMISSTNTIVYSIDPGSGADTNVLSATQPFYLTTAVTGPTDTPPIDTATPTESPTLTPTNTPTPTPSPTETPIPTVTPTLTPFPSPTLTPSPTPVPPGSAKLSLALLLDGLGNAGDNTAPTLNSLSNKAPNTPTRQVRVQIVSDDNSTQNTYTGTLQYNSATGTFDTGNNPITIAPPFNSGNYAMYVTVPFYLTRLVTGIQQFHPDTTLSATARLVTGDTINNNRLDLLDWNQLLTCQHQTPTGTCVGSDVNDDGTIDQIDNNLFLREFAVEYGDSPQ